MWRFPWFPVSGQFIEIHVIRKVPQFLQGVTHFFRDLLSAVVDLQVGSKDMGFNDIQKQ